uniref:U6 small nuclear RNA (adenine-(43)-N(6))-methyltransferase n=1 Tax=Plectus sambesii TaxID=2011161 RepID=A0A914W420_9BILA
MAFNKFMHPRNPYKERPPDFKELAKNYSVFKDHCTIDHHGKARVNFGDPEAVRALTWTLLKNDFNLDVDLPADCLVPRVTQRLNYLLWLEDLVNQNDIKGPIIGIDIGTGASCVFPLLGARQCGWDFVATDTDAKAVEVATRNVRRNQLEQHITVLA